MNHRKRGYENGETDSIEKVTKPFHGYNQCEYVYSSTERNNIKYDRCRAEAITMVRTDRKVCSLHNRL